MKQLSNGWKIAIVAGYIALLALATPLDIGMAALVVLSVILAVRMFGGVEPLQKFFAARGRELSWLVTRLILFVVVMGLVSSVFDVKEVSVAGLVREYRVRGFQKALMGELTLPLAAALLLLVTVFGGALSRGIRWGAVVVATLCLVLNMKTSAGARVVDALPDSTEFADGAYEKIVDTRSRGLRALLPEWRNPKEYRFRIGREFKVLPIVPILKPGYKVNFEDPPCDICVRQLTRECIPYSKGETMGYRDTSQEGDKTGLWVKTISDDCPTAVIKVIVEQYGR